MEDAVALQIIRDCFDISMSFIGPLQRLCHRLQWSVSAIIGTVDHGSETQLHVGKIVFLEL